MLRSLGWLAVAATFLVPSARAQTDLPVVPLSQLTLPGGWQRASTVMASPDGATLRANASGNAQLLVGSSGNPLTLATPTGDFQARFNVLMTPNADVALTLPNGQTVALTRGTNVAPLQKAPGLWQTVEIWYKAQPATLEKLVLNGVTVREGVLLTKANRTGPLALAAQSGQVALRNVAFRPLANRTVARWQGPLQYTIYEGETGDRAQMEARKVLKKDTTSALNYEVAYGQGSRYGILFDGTLNVADAGEYTFDFNHGGIAGLWIDGQERIVPVYKDLGGSTSATVPLTAGPHRVAVMFTRSWARPGMGLFVSTPGVRPQALHVATSLPEPDPVGQIAVQAADRPALVRSFIQLPEERTKRTHSLSVGSPAGRHYSVDLNQMALLQVWKGDFADVTEMWYERGEPQLLRPMGANVALPAQPALAVLAGPNATWPDSLNEQTLRYRGLTLDADGYPTTEYTLAGASITDRIMPSDAGLTRTLTVTGPASGPIMCRIAAGTSIEEVSKGLYAVNDRSYYVRLDPKSKPTLRSVSGRQELLMPVGASVQYEIVY